MLLFLLLLIFTKRENFEDTVTSDSTTSGTTTSGTTTSTKTTKSGKTVAVKPTTITCGKGKTTKKVTGVNPKCPTGFTKKK
jgi:hypothetical protein